MSEEKLTCPRDCVGEPLIWSGISKYHHPDNEPYETVDTYSCPMCGLKFRLVEY